jgi:ribonuclease BN (tRNA processing enzyme)
MRLTFLGCGDAFGTGGRFNTCFHVSGIPGGDAGEAGNDVLIDCGASSMIAMRRYGVDPNAIRTVFITHLHGDHFAGLPFMILDAQLYSRRTGPLTVAGPPGLGARLNQAMEVLFPGSSAAKRKFEVEVVELPSAKNGDGPSTVNGVEVTAYDMAHPCGDPPYAYRLGLGGRTIAYTGDTQWCEGVAACGTNVDLLIAEALFYDKQIPWHLDYMSLRPHLAAMAPKRLVLTHFGPDMLARIDDFGAGGGQDDATNTGIVPQLAQDGLTVEL